AIGILTVFDTSALILDQNAEARMYGLFLVIASLLILQFQLNNRTEAHSRGLLASNACINGALVQTHLFGILYSGVFLIAQMGFDRSRGIVRAGHYGRNLQTKAGEVRLKVPKLRQQTCEPAN